MRRQDREITDKNEIIEIIDSCKVCRLAMYDGNESYILPLNFGYDYEDDKLVLYFHSAKEGHKIHILNAGYNNCGFEMDCEHSLREGKEACDYDFKYASIIGNGKVSFVDESEEKKFALNQLMIHQTGKSFEFNQHMISGVAVFKLVAKTFTGKRCS